MWQTRNDPTPTSNTGPNGDHTTCKYCNDNDQFSQSFTSFLFWNLYRRIVLFHNTLIQFNKHNSKIWYLLHHAKKKSFTYNQTKKYYTEINIWGCLKSIYIGFNSHSFCLFKSRHSNWKTDILDVCQDLHISFFMLIVYIVEQLYTSESLHDVLLIFIYEIFKFYVVFCSVWLLYLHRIQK